MEYSISFNQKSGAGIFTGLDEGREFIDELEFLVKDYFDAAVIADPKPVSHSFSCGAEIKSMDFSTSSSSTDEEFLERLEGLAKSFKLEILLSKAASPK